jgi:glycosyltransferase involved in cell wall biosynthesis
MLQQSPRRVLHVVPSVSALRGGTSSAIWTTLRALRLRGIVADLVTTDDDGAMKRLDVPLGRFADCNGNPIRYFPRQLSTYAISGPLLAWLNRHVQDYDVVHTHGLFTFAPVAAAFVARLQQVPYVMCPHGTLERWCLRSGRAFFKRTSLRLVEGPLLAGADRVHFTSQSEFDQARELGCPMKAAVFPLGLEIEPAARSLHGVGRGNVLFLSRIDAKKGLDLTLDAFAKVLQRWPDAVLQIAGEGPEEVKASLRAQARCLGIEASLRWLGFVAGRDKQALLAQASVFVLPSWSENFGVAVAEAMAAGVPVVVTHAVGISELVAQSGAGCVIERSASALQAAIVDLLADPTKRQTMGAGGIAAVREQLSLETFGTRLAALYEQMTVR